MTEKSYRYTLEMTEAYPPDVRVFISRIVPVLVECYNFPAEYDKDLELEYLDWGSMYAPRSEEQIIGEEGTPCVKIARKVYGEHQYTDEYETSTLQLLDFQPPHINDRVDLEITCAESFLSTDKGTHKCTVTLDTNSLELKEKVVDAIDGILKKFANAHLKITDT